MDYAAQFLADADMKDIDVLARWFDQGIDLRFGNGPNIHGKTGAVEAFTQFYDSIKAMNHVREYVIVDGETICSQALVTYTALDDRQVTLPVASCMHRTQAGLLDRLYIYIDLAPLYAAA